MESQDRLCSDPQLPNLLVKTLGPCGVESPVRGKSFVRDTDRVLYCCSAAEVGQTLSGGGDLPSFEVAGPRKWLFFEPEAVRAGIVTCGGLCPGLNDVIRAVTMGLWYQYGVRDIRGFRYGYRGLTSRFTDEPMRLDPEVVADIHQLGGTVLGSSRGPQPPSEMVDCLMAQGINILFAVGGDGTQRGALAITNEAVKRSYKLSVVGIPKTIDNDIACIERTFGFYSAVDEARDAIRAAHAESKGAPYGVGLVKLMGRHSGFIAAYAALANSEVNLCLIPESRFRLAGSGGILAFLTNRLQRRRHAVVVVAEGAGQDILGGLQGSLGKDASGNDRLADIGVYLKEQMESHFSSIGMDVSVKYIDPSYTIRSIPARVDDSVFCLQLGHHAVHAAMAGKTGALVGLWNGQFTLLPIEAAVGQRKRIDPCGSLWHSVTLATGQPTEWDVD